AVWLSGYRMARVPYLLVSQHSVLGLGVQTPVYYRGVPVGTVDSIAFDPHDLRDVLVRIAIDPGVPITRGTYGVLAPQGITGVVDVELDDSGRNPARLPTSAAAPGRIPLAPSVLTTLLDSGQALLTRLSRLTADLDGFASAGNQARVRQILTHTATATRQLVALERVMQSTLATLPNLTHQAQRTLGKIDALSTQVSTLSGSLDQFARSATRLSRTGNAAAQELRLTTLPRLDALLRNLDATSRQLRALGAALQQDPQSLLYGRPSPPPGPR
ncbi:Mammalian cell entry related domain protein, partial [mine drainage metagenome]